MYFFHINEGFWICRHHICFISTFKLYKQAHEMPLNLFYLLCVFLVCLCQVHVHAEGTKEIMQNPDHNGRIVLEYEFGGFAMYGSLPENRLHIRINKPGEQIYYGFGVSIQSESGFQSDANDVEYRIVDPDGNVVVGAELQPLSGTGFINSYNEAIAGPVTFNPQGYDPIKYTCNKTGDYYIEFYFPDADYGGRREFNYFDITIVNVDNQPVPGRIWSKAWMFTVSENGGDPYANPFFGKVYILSDDNIVTSVDFNGMKPFVFTLSANGTGVKNTGNPFSDRKSIPYRSTYPQYKVFLNNPDSITFPSGSFGTLTAPTQIIGTEPPYCISVTASKNGAVEVLINFNGIPGYQIDSRDVLVAKNVQAGTSCITWDGKDGFGEEIQMCSEPINFYITYIGGLTHMPIYDVETNNNGFIVELVRPVTSSTRLALYWDDSNLPGYTTPPSEGCDGTTGCHKFDYFFGDERTINTWWYSTSEIADSLTFFNVDILLDSINVIDQNCSNVQDGSIEIFTSGGTQPILYSIDEVNYQPGPLFEHLNSGQYVVSVIDSNQCSKTYPINLKLNQSIFADFESHTGDSYNLFEFSFTGTGADYFQWDFGDGHYSDLTDPDHQYAVDSVYYVKLIAESGTPYFCKDSVTKLIEVFPELNVFVPNTFTPNGDNLNDEFRVFGTGIVSFEILIFDRWGTFLFSSTNLENSWEGIADNQPLPTGVYAYVITVEGRKGEILKKKGTVTLLR